MSSGELGRSAIATAQAILAELRRRRPEDHSLMRATTELAAAIWTATTAFRTPDERHEARVLGRLMADPAGQAFTNLLADRAYRSRDPERVVAAMIHLLDSLGPPAYLSVAERLALGGVRIVGPTLPSVVARATLRQMRERTRSVVLSARTTQLSTHLARRRAEGVRLNLNWLGEAVLGEREAEQRLDQYLQLLRRPDVEAISVKVSTLTSQLRLVAQDATLRRLRPRLRALYRAAIANPFQTTSGQLVPKLVNLDMEAYRDLELTLELFRSVLGEPAFRGLKAGIALQAYVPDSYNAQQELTRWAVDRVAVGGAPIRLRIVKGANLAAEQVESSQRGWVLPVYASKGEVDANAKRMLDFAIQPPHLAGVEVGIASHNVFDIAHGLALSAARGIDQGVSFELLEGMADPLRRVLRSIAGDVLLYGPVVEERTMQSAIAYLIRRLDENTAPENFLHHSFAMTVGDTAWREQKRRFFRACQDQHQVSRTPRRQRSAPVAAPSLDTPFRNEPDTDFTQTDQREQLLHVLAAGHDAPPFDVPFQIDGVLDCPRPLVDGFDPSRPGVVPYRHPLATPPQIERAIACAVRTQRSWSRRPVEERSAILARVAEHLRSNRQRLILAMVLDAGKAIEQADAEVSEAIDFAEYYRRTYLDLVGSDSIRATAKGVVLVASPWNFPLAIPAGGVLAALVAGNSVILKPASETPWVASLLATACWDAGVPREALQLVFTSDEWASRLVTDPRIAAVILTGGTATAQLFHELRPGIDLMAETGGKNALIVSPAADRDLAIASAVKSAFGHAGQKCSAASLLICVGEVYDDPGFRMALRDATRSLPVGSAWNPDSVVTPLIHPPTGALAESLGGLAPGEHWLLESRCDRTNPRLWHPAIKLLTQEGGPGHRVELFGPVLGVLRARSLDDALRIANATPYGLTAAMHSLDEREQQRFIDGMRAGNLYVNRDTTGAIVGRQPFGGYQASSFGPGAKAGGPNYVAQLVHLRDRRRRTRREVALLPAVELLCGRLRAELPEHSFARLRQAAAEYAAALEDHFGRDHEPIEVLGQVNVFGYRELSGLLVRVTRSSHPVDVACICAAALTCMDRFELSVAPDAAPDLGWLAQVPGALLRQESAAEVAARVERVSAGPLGQPRAIERIRVAGPPEPELANAAALAGIHLATQRPLRSGRWELLHYVRELSISMDTHRYGNLSGEALAPLGARHRGVETVPDEAPPRTAAE